MILTGRPLVHLGGTTSDVIYEVDQLLLRGYTIWLMCPADKEGNIANKKNLYMINPSDRKYKFLPGPLYRLLYAIHRGILLRKIDKAIHFSYIHAHSVFSALAAVVSFRGKKTILHLHSISAKDRFVMSKPLSRMSPWFKLIHLSIYLMTCMLEIFVYNNVKLIVCVSEWEQKDALKKGFLKKEQILLLRNGIDTDKFCPKPEATQSLRKHFGIDNSRIVCVFLGRIVPKNGPLLIAQAIPIVNKELSNVTFIFVGDGVEKEKLNEHIIRANVTNVLCLGSTPAEAVFPIGDIFVSHVSTLVEGHGQTILEAMSSGLATITGRDTIKEKIFKKDELILIEKDNPSTIAEAVVQLANNESLRNLLSLRGREKVVKEFSIKMQYDKFEDMLRSI